MSARKLPKVKKAGRHLTSYLATDGSSGVKPFRAAEERVSLTKRQKRPAKIAEFNQTALSILSERGEVDSEHLRRLICNRFRDEGKRQHLNAPELKARLSSLEKKGLVHVAHEQAARGDASLIFYTITEKGRQNLPAALAPLPV